MNTDNPKIIPVILAGGSGTRLWPLSRKMQPKQFIALAAKQQSMFQLTMSRLKAVMSFEVGQPLVICNEQHRFIAAEQMRQLGYAHANLLLEPLGRNTAPAVALAALQSVSKGESEQTLLLVLAADHHIEDVAKFHAALSMAVAPARAGDLVTFGVVPNHPEVGYGYIESGEALQQGGFRVARFVEKPDVATAKAYVESGRFLWNSGMFMFSIGSYLRELELHAPDILVACQRALEKGSQDHDFTRPAEVEFSACRDISIDYAVMEPTKHAVVVSLEAGWSDVGSWGSLWSVSPKDANGNTLQGDIMAIDTHDSMVRGSDRLIAAVGVQDLVIVDTPDALLVAHREKVQQVKMIVDSINANKRPEAVHHREVYRPWGKYDSIDQGTRYQVKRITVKPGAKLSVQMHHHRAEHWVVVRGTAKVTNGDRTYFVAENESTYIPIGQVHALENPGKIDLEMIEIQSGSYLAEDDIVRFEDRYGRVDA